jgi:hypothetical protein
LCALQPSLSKKIISAYSIIVQKKNICLSSLLFYYKKRKGKAKSIFQVLAFDKNICFSIFMKKKQKTKNKKIFVHTNSDLITNLLSPLRLGPLALHTKKN